ncbi:DUF2845 domain-containing protein [Ectopseudomonas guguanensis]|jgi:hypothetical protein|uniref:DUF2845 domain-containing protein n=1 Tax=Ectopseudomonas guguanensis TaxID=1198456 RepID=UPI0012D5E98B|nr:MULTISPECIES: DUF2845 domain-containing protein [Pseudomonas]MPT19587.1 DUF2845 domain-containing protein [Pseudomonas sp.]WJH58569.1 DUF2845 domain-containing protein [Pseudomonas guguanensis]
MIMRSLSAITLIALTAGPFDASAQADTLRCGSALVSLGDRPFEVERKCGAPVHRDPIGYTLGSYERREYMIEEWVYGPSNGMLSILRFEGNRLVAIERRRER